jgi:glutamate-1-semialdehyde 2,1-aminomutase
MSAVSPVSVVNLDTIQNSSSKNKPPKPEHNSAGYRKISLNPVEIDKARVKALLKKEWEYFLASTPSSNREYVRARKSLPLGVPSSFQYWEPYPISIVSAEGAYVVDADSNKLLDMSMGFGAMLVGHLNQVVVDEITESMKTGMLFVTPSPISTSAAELICKRFAIDRVRFTNSGTESTMYAIRLARAYTRKNGIVKIEGGYHGGYDALTVSTKPSLDRAGFPNSPSPVHSLGSVGGEVHVVPYNNIEALRRVFEVDHGSISCFILEPVLENLSIVLPDEGYLEGVRALCDQYKIVLIFDEVKTGLTAGVQGAAQKLGVTPDLICLAKSIGGGVPVAAFGGKQRYMDLIDNNTMYHFGTFNGNPLSMAGIRAVDKLCTPQALARAEEFNLQALNRMDEIINTYQLPAQTVGFGVKGAVSWGVRPIRNYRDYKATDFDMAELTWLWGINRGIMTPPGQDDQWLVSLAHGQTEIDLLVNNFAELAKALRQ